MFYEHQLSKFKKSQSTVLEERLNYHPFFLEKMKLFPYKKAIEDYAGYKKSRKMFSGCVLGT